MSLIAGACADWNFNNPLASKNLRDCLGPGCNNEGGGNPTDRLPIGNFDNLTVTSLSSGNLRINATGWAFDPDFTNATTIELWGGGPQGVGIFLGQVATSIFRSGVNSTHNLPNSQNVGFSFQTDVPDPGVGFDVYAYARNHQNQSQTVLLQNSPRNYTPAGGNTGTTLLAINPTNFVKEKTIHFTIPFGSNQVTTIPNFQVVHSSTNAITPAACRAIKKQESFILIAGCTAKMRLDPGRNELEVETATSPHPSFALHPEVSTFLNTNQLRDDLYFEVKQGSSSWTARINTSTDSSKVVNLSNGYRVHQYIKRGFWQNNNRFEAMLIVMFETYHNDPTGRMIVGFGNNDLERYDLNSSSPFNPDLEWSEVNIYYKGNLKLRAHEPEAWGENHAQSNSGAYKKIRFSGFGISGDGQLIMRPFNFAFTNQTSGSVWNTLQASDRRTVAIADYNTWKTALESRPQAYFPTPRFNPATQLNDARNRLDHYYSDNVAFRPVRNPRSWAPQGNNPVFLNIGHHENSDLNYGLIGQNPPQSGYQPMFQLFYNTIFQMAVQTGHAGPLRIPLLATKYKDFLRRDSYLDERNGEYDFWSILNFPNNANYNYGTSVGSIFAWSDSSGQGTGFMRHNSYNTLPGLEPMRARANQHMKNYSAMSGGWTNMNMTHFSGGSHANAYDLTGDYLLWLRMKLHAQIGLATAFTDGMWRTDSERTGRMMVWMLRFIQYMHDDPAFRTFLKNRVAEKVTVYKNAYDWHYNQSANTANIPGLSSPEATYWMMGFAMEGFTQAIYQNIRTNDAQWVVDLVFNRSAAWVHPETNPNSSNYGIIASFIHIGTGSQTWSFSSYGFGQRWAMGLVQAGLTVRPSNTNTDRVLRMRDHYFSNFWDDRDVVIDHYWGDEDNWVSKRNR